MCLRVRLLRATSHEWKSDQWLSYWKVKVEGLFISPLMVCVCSGGIIYPHYKLNINTRVHSLACCQYTYIFLSSSIDFSYGKGVFISRFQWRVHPWIFQKEGFETTTHPHPFHMSRSRPNEALTWKRGRRYRMAPREHAHIYYVWSWVFRAPAMAMAMDGSGFVTHQNVTPQAMCLQKTV